MLQNQCKNAIDEMTDVVITTDLILNWLNKKHRKLFKPVILDFQLFQLQDSQQNL